MAQSFIGSRISLTSISDIRYRGTLHGIDHVNATIQLRNVMSMGTEARRPPHEYIPPSDTPYEYIVFRAKEVKDLALDTVTAVNVHNDPGILHASQPYTPQPPLQPGYVPAQEPVAIGTQQPAPPPAAAPAQKSNGAAATRQQTHGGGRGGGQQGGKTPASGQNSRNQNRNNGATGGNRNGSASASKSLENVERALGDLRVSSSSRGNNRNGGQNASEIRAGELRLPTGDFDFQQSNARFDKAAIARSQQQNASDADEKTNPSDSDGDEPAKNEQKDKEREREKYYNPTKSFFDDISSDSKSAANRGGRGGAPGERGGRRGGHGRSRREEERERNVATFGEAGDVRGYSRWGGRRRGGGNRSGNGGTVGASGGTKNNG